MMMRSRASRRWDERAIAESHGRWRKVRTPIVGGAHDLRRFIHEVQLMSISSIPSAASNVARPVQAPPPSVANAAQNVRSTQVAAPTDSDGDHDGSTGGSGNARGIDTSA